MNMIAKSNNTLSFIILVDNKIDNKAKSKIAFEKYFKRSKLNIKQNKRTGFLFFLL